MSYYLTLSNATSENNVGQRRGEDFTIDFNNPFDFKTINLIGLGPDGDRITKNRFIYQLALSSAAIPYSWHNVSDKFGNNVMTVMYDGVEYDVTIPNGQYSVDLLNQEIHVQLKILGLYSLNDFQEEIYPVNVVAVNSLGKIQVEVIGTGNEVSFNEGLSDLLGYEVGQYPLTEGIHRGNLNADINRGITSININCSIIKGSYTNEFSGQVLYNFVPNGPISSMMSLIPIQRIYLPIYEQVTTIRMWLTDNFGRLIDLNGEGVSYTLHIKQTGL